MQVFGQSVFQDLSDKLGFTSLVLSSGFCGIIATMNIFGLVWGKDTVLSTYVQIKALNNLKAFLVSKD